MTLGVVTGGTGPLLKAVVQPFTVGGLSVRGSIIKAVAGGGTKVTTGSRLRMTHLMALDSTSSRNIYGASKDQNGLWSEWSAAEAFACPNFTAGSRQKSIGSLQDEDVFVEESGVVFPDLSIGSGKINVFRTLVAEGAFTDQTRRAKQPAVRSAFKFVGQALDQEQWKLLHRFFRAVGIRPFMFDWADPNADPVSTDTQRFTVRLRDPSVADDLVDVAMATVTFDMIELITLGRGGDV